MKSKRTSLVMLVTIILMMIVVHNKLHSETVAEEDRLVKTVPEAEIPSSYFATSFLRMAQ